MRLTELEMYAIRKVLIPVSSCWLVTDSINMSEKSKLFHAVCGNSLYVS